MAGVLGCAINSHSGLEGRSLKLKAGKIIWPFLEEGQIVPFDPDS
jgi:hypothetical protein